MHLESRNKVFSLPRPRSIRARYTLVASVLSLIVVLIIGIGLDLVVRNRVQAGVFDETERAATQWIAAGARTIPSLTRVNLLQLVDSYGRVVESSRPVSGRPPLSTVRPPAHDRIQHLTECSPRGGCVMLTAIQVSPQEARQLWHGNPHVVYAGMKQPPILATYRLELFIAAGAFPLVVLMVWLTWCMVGRTLRPMEALREQTSKITFSDLSLRMPQLPGQDEIARLARTADQTLARLQGEAQQQRRFASDVSHELRNPIAGLRTQLEEALLYPGDVDPHHAIRSALSATDRLEAIINDRLALARLRAEDSAPPEPVDLGVLVTQETATRDHGVPVHAHAACGIPVRGYRMQLIRVIANLLDNAQRHADTIVEVTAERTDDQAIVTVTDDGDGITPHDRERVFERFTRLDDGRRRDPGGSGLGLAISRDIAHAHHGSLQIEDSPQGTRFVLRLPLDTQPAVFSSPEAVTLPRGATVS
jgi:signal transduction histidine kinase